MKSLRRKRPSARRQRARSLRFDSLESRRLLAPVVEGDSYVLRVDGALDATWTASTEAMLHLEFDGKVLDFDDNTGDFEIYSYRRRNDIAIEYKSLRNDWYFNIETVDSQQFEVGLYDNATRFLYAEPGTPGLYVGGEGHAPGALNGWFEVHAVKYLGEDHPVGLEATFGIETTGLTGHIRYIEPGYESGVLVNDSANGGAALTAELVSSTAHGSLSFQADGTFQYTPDAGFIGSDSFTYRAHDGNAYSDPVEVTLEVKLPNVAPTAQGDAATTDEETPVHIDVVGNDTDENDDLLSVGKLFAPSHGTAEIAEDGTILYTPPQDFHGTATLTYRVDDGFGGSDTAQVTITVLPVNDRPTAVDDLAKTMMNRSVEIDVLGNDSDIDGDVLSVFEVGEAEHGLVEINANGKLTYTPETDFFGADHFTYTVSDGNGGTAMAVVEIDVRESNTIPVGLGEEYRVVIDKMLEAIWAGPVDSLWWMESDPGDFIGQGLTYHYTADEGSFNVSQTYASHGDVTLGFSGSGDNWTARFVAPGGEPLEVGLYEGATRFPFQDSSTPGMDVSGNGRGHNTLTGWFEVHAIKYDDQGKPIGIDASFEQNGGLRGRVRHVREGIQGGVLVNDLDDDGDRLTAELATGPSHGTLAFHSDGTFTYVPDAGYTGLDWFTYVVSDGYDVSEPIEVVLTVDLPNAEPAARYDSVSALQETPLDIDVLQNDEDSDGDPISVIEVTQPAHGTVVTGAGGVVTYTPETGFVGEDSFHYTIDDGRGGTATTRVDIVVRAANAAPIGSTDYYTIPLGEELIVDWAAPQESLLVMQSSPGDFIGQGQDWYFDDELAEFRLSQTYANHNDLRVRVDGTDDYFTVTLDGPDQDRLEVGLYENAFRFPFQGGNTPGLAVSGNHRGCNTLNGEFIVHAVEYGPDGKAIGIDASFVQHCEMGSSKLEGRIRVAPPGSQSGVLANDRDADGDAVSAELVSTTSHGTLTFQRDGTFRYLPEDGYRGLDTFTYVVSDGLGTSEPVTVTLNVGPVNVAEDDFVMTDEDTGLTIDLTINDLSGEGGPLSLQWVGEAEHGTIQLGGGGLVRYTPHENFHGSDTFSYGIADGWGGIDFATVTVTVNSVNDLPVAAINHIDGSREVGAELVVSAWGRDVEDPSATLHYHYEIVQVGQSDPLVSESGTNRTSVAFTPQAAGAYHVTVTVADSDSGSTSTQQTITVGAVSHFELAFNKNTGLPMGTVSPAGTSAEAIFHEWEDVSTHLWVTVDEDLAGETVDLRWKLAALESRFGQPQFHEHLGNDGGWVHTQQAGLGVSVGTLNSVDFSQYEVGDRVLVASVTFPRNKTNPSGVPMNQSGQHPQPVRNNVIELWGAESATSDASYGIDVEVTGRFMAVVYDSDDNGNVGLSDFAHFVASFGREANSESPHAFRYDFDRNGSVGLSDFSLFVRHFGLDSAGDEPISVNLDTNGTAPRTTPSGLQGMLESEPLSMADRDAALEPAGARLAAESFVVMPVSQVDDARDSTLTSRLTPQTTTAEEAAFSVSDLDYEALQEGLLLEDHALPDLASETDSAFDQFWEQTDETVDGELLEDLDEASLAALWE